MTRVQFNRLSEITLNILWKFTWIINKDGIAIVYRGTVIRWICFSQYLAILYICYKTVIIKNDGRRVAFLNVSYIYSYKKEVLILSFIYSSYHLVYTEDGVQKTALGSFENFKYLRKLQETDISNKHCKMGFQALKLRPLS